MLRVNLRALLVLLKFLLHLIKAIIIVVIRTLAAHRLDRRLSGIAYILQIAVIAVTPPVSALLFLVQ